MNFLIVIMASGIARGRVRTTTTTATESRKMAAILQVIGWQRHAALVYHLLLWSCYDQLTPVKTRYLLTSITWRYRGLKCAAHRGHVFFKLTADQVLLFSIGSRAHAMLTCWKPGRIVRKPANGSPGLKFIWIITFSSIQMFFAALFWVYGDYKPQNRKSNSKQKTSPQSYNTQINILPFPGLAQTVTEQLGQGATLLGWPKSIY